MDDQTEPSQSLNITIPYKPRAWAREIHPKLKRFNVLVVHRGAGKTVMAMNELIMRAVRGPEHALYSFILPLRNQAKRTVWEPMKYYLEPFVTRGMVSLNNSDLTATFSGVNFSRIMILGADNPDSLRGIHQHYCVLDEYGDMHANIWQVIRPTLTNHHGGALWIGTPKGKSNQFYEKYQQSQNPKWDDWYGVVLPWNKTGAITRQEVEMARLEMHPAHFMQEMECNWDASLVGSYYAREIAQLRDFGHVTYQRLFRSDLQVHTAWDLGVKDKMAVWFFQLLGNEIHLIDFEEHSNYGFKEWIEILNLKRDKLKYRYGTHIAPHDIKNRELGTGVSRLESAQEMGLYFDQCPKQDLMDGVELVRRHLPRCRFQLPECNQGVEALNEYKAKIDKQGQGLGPDHNWASHAADSFRYAITYIVQIMSAPQIIRAFMPRR